MSKWLSEEWFDETRALTTDQPDRPGLTGRLQFEVTGGPDGEVRYYQVLEDGRWSDGASGTIDDPDVTLSSGWADAVAMERGELDPNVAFMQGKLKVTGSMALVMTYLPATRTPEYQTLRQQIAGITEF